MTHTDKFLWLRSEYDSYQEWFDVIGSPELKSSKDWADTHNDFGDSKYYLIKQELETVFRKRQQITEKEVHEYAKSIMKPVKRSIFIYLLIIYIDFYHEDENYKKALVEDTIKDFKITKEEMKGGRNGWEPDWVKTSPEGVCRRPPLS